MESSRTSRNKRTSDRGVNLVDVVRAVKNVMVEKEKVGTAARCYNVPRTTLRRYLTKISMKYDDISNISDQELEGIIKLMCTYTACAVRQVFSDEEEEGLLEYSKKCSAHYYGLSIVELRELAYQFAIKLGIKYPSQWDKYKMCGLDWYYGFMRRHRQLTLRTPEQTSLNRTKSFNKENVQLFFRNLDSTLSEYPFCASDIWNMDETGFSTVPTKVGKVISLKGSKRVGQIVSQERGSMITMAMAVNAEGNSIPPFFLFPRQNMQSTFMENASTGAVGFANGSGWMQQPEFTKYIHFFIDKTKASKESPKLLLIDNHSSHISIEALDLANKHGVTLLSFPPHCSHRLQPLDVSVYGPVKNFYKSQCNAWQKNNAGKYLDIRHIPGLVRSTLDLALTPKNIKAGFCATGIAPYNPDIFADSDFVQAVLNSENNRLASNAEINDEELQGCIVSNTSEVIVQKEVTISIEPSESTSRESHLSNVLTSIGPLQAAVPAKKSNRGRKPMASTILTSPECLSALREKQQQQNTKNKTKKKMEENIKKTVKRGRPPKQTPKKIPSDRDEEAQTSMEKTSKKTAKRGRPPKQAQKKTCSDKDEDFQPPTKIQKVQYFEEDLDFCIICLQTMPRHLNRNNSIACIECKRDVHLKCAKMRTSYFICKNCDSD